MKMANSLKKKETATMLLPLTLGSIDAKLPVLDNTFGAS